MFKKEIDRLNDRFNSVPFSPHLTLGRLSANKTSHDALNSLKEIPDSVLNEKIVSGIDCLKCTASPYQNLVVSLEASDGLARVQQQITLLCPGFIPKEEYHISLLYGSVPCAELNSEKTRLSDKLPEYIRFSSLCLVHLAGGPVSWRILWKRNM